MKETINLKSIVLSRQDFNEKDVLVTVYNKEKGKINLVARGAKKSGSKLAGHIEPLNFVDLMFIKGRKIDYIGSVRNIENFLKVKSDLDKLNVSLNISRKYKNMVKEGDGDADVFKLIFESLNFLENNNKIDLDFFYNLFILKFFYLLGFSLELNNCVSCLSKIIPDNNTIDISRGGLVCSKCARPKQHLTISNNCIKLLKLAVKTSYLDLLKLKLDKESKKDFSNIVSSFEKYYSY